MIHLQSVVARSPALWNPTRAANPPDVSWYNTLISKTLLNVSSVSREDVHSVLPASPAEVVPDVPESPLLREIDLTSDDQDNELEFIRQCVSSDQDEEAWPVLWTEAPVLPYSTSSGPRTRRIRMRTQLRGLTHIHRVD